MAERNFGRVQHAELRTKIVVGKIFDAHYNADHDALTTAYRDFWRNGLSSPWQGFDKQATPELSKELFDKLHGLIFWHRDVAFHTLNQAQPPARRIEREKYDAQEVDENGVVTVWRSEASQVRIDALKLDGIEIPPPVSV